MAKSVLHRIGCILAVSGCLLFSACSTTKFVPEGKYLLNKAHIKVKDTKDVTSSDLNDYLRQKQNTEILGFWKLQLDIYNTAPADTTTKGNKWLAKNAHKVGEAPVIYDEDLTRVSMEQLGQTMRNKGYFNAVVDTQKVYKKKKVNLTYIVTANEPYTIRKYNVDIDRPEVRAIATNSNCLIKNGMQFSADVLDRERQRIATKMHNEGYFYFDKSMLEYVADSSYNCLGVDVDIQMSKYISQLPDSVTKRLYAKYTIHQVYFHIDYDPSRLPADVELHIEQGKRLYEHQDSTAIVTCITGIYRENITIHGTANHGGTTNMPDRHDALLTACELNLAFESLLLEENDKETVGTIGFMEVFPNAVSIIPDKVQLTLEIRTCQPEKRKRILEKLTAVCEEISERRGTTIERTLNLDQKEMPMSPLIQSALKEAMIHQNVPVHEYVSMAGHDAANIARFTESGMIFTQSVNGKSHCADEYSKPETIEETVNVLAEAIPILDKEMSAHAAVI